ncbi:M15 family metallopeptidase [Lentzea sp.]|uniref:M15 family metallopeptidase n=1 Tax=Lentzea sp. TaxID=56099 RepID=UPI002CE27FB4|nr:M15 family metallopeptidase [Lentzea sp.]HUQ58913.1 M15 family metallopeptidase [Lentzea sp.]
MNEPSGGTLGRRSFLSVAGGLAAAASVGFAPAALAAAPAASTSANGWPLRHKDIAQFKVEGSGAVVALRSGDVATVLLHVARRFHYEVAPLRPGQISQTGGSAPFESNYLSGTAFAIRPDLYPAGAKGNFFPHELAAVRDVLAECEGIVRWGGDFKKSPKEGHFQLDVKPGDIKLVRVARKIAQWSPGKAAGTPRDVFDESRRRPAKVLAERQIATG